MYVGVLVVRELFVVGRELFEFIAGSLVEFENYLSE